MKYQILYADPPWEQKAGRPLNGYKVNDGVQVWNSSTNRTNELPYPTMSVNEIAALNINSLCEKNAFLFLWVTNKYLLESQKVIEAWGFKYVSCIVWKKKRMGGGLGGVVRVTSEYLLFCRKGNLKATGVIPESVIEAKRPYKNGAPCHSKKPTEFRTMIESVSVGYRKVELFAREESPGWDVFGNEVQASIEIPATNVE